MKAQNLFRERLHIQGRKTIIWPYFFWRTSRTPSLCPIWFSWAESVFSFILRLLKKGFWVLGFFLWREKMDIYHLEEVILIVTLIRAVAAILSECRLHASISDFRLVLIYGGSRLPWWLSGKEFSCNAGDLSLIPGLGRSPGEGNGKPLQYSCLRHPMDRSLVGYSPQGHRVELSDLTTFVCTSNPCPDPRM